MAYSSTGNNEIRLLEKQKSLLQDQIQRTKESKMDQKTKQETIQLLEDQIQQLETEIQQKRSEKLERKQNTGNNTADQKTAASSVEGSGLDANMSSLIQASATFSQAQVINQVKGGLHGKANVLKMEIKLDAGRMGGEIKGKSAELQKTESLERKLDHKFGEALKKANDQTDKAAKDSSTDDIGKTKDADQSKDIEQSKDIDADSKSNDSANGDVKADSRQQKNEAAGTYTRVDVKI
jgi:hypothetical protein